MKKNSIFCKVLDQKTILDIARALSFELHSEGGKILPFLIFEQEISQGSGQPENFLFSVKEFYWMNFICDSEKESSEW